MHASSINQPDELPLLEPGWPAVSDTARPWTRWWWPGSAVDQENLTRQLEAISTAGLGGVEITPIYGARGYEDRYIDFLSPRWMEMLAFTGREADRLGLGVDMATGTGWPFGGPWVTSADAAQKLVLQDGQLGLEPTGQTVKRAAPGGEGLVLDPYSTKAMDHYTARFDQAFADFQDKLIRSQFHDSFEYYGASGTPSLEATFEAMHGYRLGDWAKVLLDAETTDSETTARLKADYRTTLDRMHQAYLKEWTAWAHLHGWKTRNQSHGAPANLLDLYAIADIPETEIFGSTPFPIPGLRRDPDAIRQGQDLPEPLVSRMASSAAHVTGKLLVSCESATWLRDHWKVTLADVKPELDRVLLDGINHVFYHGTVYSPADAPWPGWLFYAATQFNPNNPWWRDFAALNAYVTRVQSVLQGGRPDNPVLMYWPVHDVWHDANGLMKQLTVHGTGFITESSMGNCARTLLRGGYAIDYISDSQLEQVDATADGRIITPGSSYAVLVVPATQHMPVATLERIIRLAREGAVVIFTQLPEDVPGLAKLDERRAEFARLRASIGFSSPASDGFEEVILGSGKAIRGNVVEALARIEAASPEPMIGQGLTCIRRRTDLGHDYFIANLGSTAVEDWITLGVPVKGATILDPLDGKGGVAALRNGVLGKTEIYLQMEPGESLVVRTRKNGPALGPGWPYTVPAGDPIPLRGNWSVEFLTGGPVLPASFQTRHPRSWTDRNGPDYDRFAGTARYTITFDLPETGADDWLLDLGDVRESARLTLNGILIGTAWSLPFRMRIGAALHPGPNTLEIEVTNTAANRIRDMDRRGVGWKIMREINFVDIRYQPFDASGWKILPAGLLGPVTLQPLQALSP